MNKREIDSSLSTITKRITTESAILSLSASDKKHLTKKRKLNSLNSLKLTKTYDSNSIVSQNHVLKNILDPKCYIKQLLNRHGLKFEIRQALSMQNFFIPVKQEHYDSYKHEIIAAVRTQNLKLIREHHKKGLLLELCCNRSGDSLIHLACRRGFTDVVKLLVKECDSSLRICDEYGRTPMHDACWAIQPNFELMEFLMKEEPTLLFLWDSRNHSPLNYMRREHWDEWIAFLSRNEKLLVECAKSQLHLQTCG